MRFGQVTLPKGVARSNADLAADFLDLTFELESGEKLSHLLRYETPVRVYLRSPALAAYRPDLAALLARLRTEAGIDIAETSDPAAAQIFIEAVPSAQITKVFPSAACFIVPGERDWKGFMHRRADARVRWPDQPTLEGAAIFLPLDTTPQDVRDCLHEEITQALGPADDLYRLPDSIWNDDNFHGMATPFDMTILRALYQPEFHSGMSREEAAAVLPKVLARVNPKGEGVARTARAPESRAWAKAIEAALDREAPRARRLEAATLAAQIAAEMRPIDHRLGVALLTLGRLTLRRDPETAAKNFTEAYSLFRREFGDDDVRTAQAGVHLAALALGTGQYDIAITLADRHAAAAVGGAERHPPRRAPVDQGRGAGRRGQARRGAGRPARQPALGPLWVRRRRRRPGARAGAARGADAARERMRRRCCSPSPSPSARSSAGDAPWRAAATGSTGSSMPPSTASSSSS